MSKLVFEIIFSDAVKLGPIENIDETCFIYFHTGKDCDYLTSYQFVKNVEKTFNININFIDISFFYNGIKNKDFKFSDLYVNEIIERIKSMYISSINKYLKEE